MALSEAILVCLTEGQMTGYDLAKRFSASIGFFWKADHQQIYRELAKLRLGGLIDGHEVVQSGKPNKMVYAITEEGRMALRAWASKPSVPAAIKDDLLVRFYALSDIDLEPLGIDLIARIEYHTARLDRLGRILESKFANGANDRSEAGRLLGLRLGLSYEKLVVDWCREALQMVDGFARSGSEHR